MSENDPDKQGAAKGPSSSEPVVVSDMPVPDTNEPRKHEHRWAARIRLLEIRAKNNWLFLCLGLLAGFLIFGGTTIKAINDIVEIFEPKPDALSVAREGTRDQISRDFVETAYRRLYLSRNFLSRIDRRAPSPEIYEAWTLLTRTIEYMASRTLVYANSFEDFYGDARRAEYENGIQIDFNSITNSVVNLRYSQTVRKLEFPDGSNAALTEAEGTELKNEIKTLNDKLDRLTVRIYLFTSCFDKRRQTSETCK